MRRLALWLVLVVLSGNASGQKKPDGQAAFHAFTEWRKSGNNAALPWEEALQRYEFKLRADGMSGEAATATLRLIEAYDEAIFYNRVYSEPAQFNTQPNRLLAEAVAEVKPGLALDVAMGQGRNGLFLAAKGWVVTGFDVSDIGLRKAKEQAAAQRVMLTAVRASDEEFDFGYERWDLIAIIYAMEKRSVRRVREALKPGGLVVVEAGHKEASGAPFEYDTNELLKVFEGFRILKYEDTLDTPDWGKDKSKIRLVRLVAQKPR